MSQNKIYSMIGFAIKANKLLMGLDNIQDTKKQIYLIIADRSVSERTLASLRLVAQNKKTKLLIIDEKLENIVHKTNCKVIAMLDKNMSENIIINAGNGGGNLVD